MPYLRGYIHTANQNGGHGDTNNYDIEDSLRDRRALVN